MVVLDQLETLLTQLTVLRETILSFDSKS
jgi:hypothetical protein